MVQGSLGAWSKADDLSVVRLKHIKIVAGDSDIPIDLLPTMIVLDDPANPAVRQRPRGCAEVEEHQVTLVYQHELPNVPGKSIKGVPGGYSPDHTHPKSAFIYATVLEGAIRSQVNDGLVPRIRKHVRMELKAQYD